MSGADDIIIIDNKKTAGTGTKKLMNEFEAATSFMST